MKIRADNFQVFAAVILVIFLTTGCGSVRYPANHVLNFPQPAAKGKVSGLRAGTVLIREFRCPQYLCRGPIVFRPTPDEIGYYEYHRWAVNPRIAITQFMAETLRAHSLFNDVTSYERGIEATTYILRGQIERLEEFDSGRDVRVECAISAELVDAQTGSVLWSDRASETLPVSQKNLSAIVNALTQASQMTINNLAKSMANKLTPAR